MGVNRFNRVPLNPFTADFPRHIETNYVGSVSRVELNCIFLLPAVNVKILLLYCCLIVPQVLYQEPNPGIVYRYVIPGNANLQRNSHLAHNTGITSLLKGKATLMSPIYW